MSAVLYPGSFDPVTNGHLDVIRRLRAIFGRVVVAVADSPRKNYLFSNSERTRFVREALGNVGGVEVVSSSGLTVELAEKENISVIARSARTVSDWEHEYALAIANKKLNGKIETIFVMADPEFAAISSSLIREIASFNGDVSAFVPKNVETALAALQRNTR